jgi:hypothetical protein
MVAETFVDFRGHRYTPPFRCLCCGSPVSLEQFCWGRMCAYCDVGACQTGVLTFEPEHGRPDVILAAPAIDSTSWCAVGRCPAHAANRPLGFVDFPVQVEIFQ